VKTPLLLVAAFVCGCGNAPARWIEEARRAHAEADARLREQDLRGADAVLRRLVTQPVPSNVAAADRRVVLQDAYARLARVGIEEGLPEQALRDADAGLELGEQEDVFTCTLRILRGHALEALGRDPEAARDYETAQVIAAALLERTLADGGHR
jgi:predicted negative regulator of RcsB-dependent stress response